MVPSWGGIFRMLVSAAVLSQFLISKLTRIIRQAAKNVVAQAFQPVQKILCGSLFYFYIVNDLVYSF
jgi:hypothetical protein